MDKSELSSYLENLKLAASKCSSFSVHLNELKKSVFAVGRPNHPEVRADTLNYNTEDNVNGPGGQNEFQDKSLDKGTTENVTHEDLYTTEEKEDVEFVYEKADSLKNTSGDEKIQVDNIVSSESELALPDAFSNRIVEDADEDAEFVYEKADSLKNTSSDEKIQESIIGIKNSEEKENVSDEQFVGNVKDEEDCFTITNNLYTSSDFTSSDEDDNQVYSELLKQIEIEETSSRQMKNNLETENNTESYTSDTQSEDLDEVSNMDLQNDKKPKYQKPLFKRTKEIMESIEEHNEDLEDINAKLTSGNDEISSEKLLYIQPGNNCSKGYRSDITNKCLGIHSVDGGDYDNDINLKIKSVNSKISIQNCKKRNSQTTIASRKESRDNINCGRSDKMSIKSKSLTSSNRKRGPNNEKLSIKKIPSLSKYTNKNVKSGQSIKLKSTTNFQKKNMVANKTIKNSKTKTNDISKVVSKNINKVNRKQDITQPTNNSNNRYFKSIYTMKNNLPPQESGNELNISNGSIPKSIEPLIKTNPTNIFLRNELDKICDKEEQNIGAGDGINDKVRSKAIMDSMDHSINENLKTAFVPSHFFKSTTIKKEIPLSHSPFMTRRQKQTNKIENSSISNKSSTKKAEKPSLPNKTIKNNSKLDSYKSDIVLFQSEHKNIKSKRESTGVSPKYILAQLEKEIVMKKSKDNFENENELDLGIKSSKIVDHVNYTLKHNEILNPKSQRLEKKSLDNVKDGLHTKNSCSSVVILKSNRNTKKELAKENCSKIKRMNELSNISSSNLFQFSKKNGTVGNKNVPEESISRITSKMVNLNFDGTKPKLTSFPFILGQSTNKSYNIQANLQQALSIMMMLPSDSVKQTLSVETKISSRSSTRTADTAQTRQTRCPACVLNTDREVSNNNLGEDPWDTDFAQKKFIRCTCLPRNTVSFKTVIKQLLMETSMSSLLPMSETSDLYEESIDRNYDKQLCRRTDLTHLTKLLHATQKIRDRLVT